MENYKTKIVDLDTKRGKDEAQFLCLHQDCFASFSAEVPKRKNMTKGIDCPKCGRDFFLFWIFKETGDTINVNFGRKRKKR